MESKTEENNLLALESVFAGYHKKEVLHGISLSIKKGEIVCLIGPNGAGKSTILKIISGLLRPERGRIFFDGKDITLLWPHRRARAGISYLIQGGSVFLDLTIRENLELGGGKVHRDELKRRIGEVFDFFPKLREISPLRAGTLSGGEKQMLALGMTLMRKPKILLLDEPSAGLSPNLVSNLMEKVREIHRRTGVTVFLVEQNLKLALRISQGVFLLKNGKIVEKGEPNDFLGENRLENVFFG